MVTYTTPVFQSFNITGVEHISPRDALEELQNWKVILLDVREEAEYMVEFIPLDNVFHFPGSTIIDNLKNIPAERPIIVLSLGGVQSVKVVSMLKIHGFVNSFNLDGGLRAWKSEKLPYEKILPDSYGDYSSSCSCKR